MRRILLAGPLSGSPFWVIHVTCSNVFVTAFGDARRAVSRMFRDAVGDELLGI